MANSDTIRWDSRGKHYNGKFFKPAANPSNNMAQAVRILMSGDVASTKEAEGIVARLADRYLERKELEKTAPGFGTVRKKLGVLQKRIRDLVDEIRDLDEVTISAISGSSLVLLDEEEELDSEQFRNLLDSAQPEKFCNKNQHEVCKSESMWINKLVNMDNYLEMVSKFLQKNKRYSDKGPRNGPYLNLRGTPELRLVVDGWSDFENYGLDPSAAKGIEFYDFINNVKIYAEGDLDCNRDWAHGCVLKYMKLIAQLENCEINIKRLRECVESGTNTEDELWELSEIEEHASLIEEFFDDDLA